MLLRFQYSIRDDIVCNVLKVETQYTYIPCNILMLANSVCISSIPIPVISVVHYPIYVLLWDANSSYMYVCILG